MPQFKHNGYAVSFYESGRFAYEERFKLLSEARNAVTEFIAECREYRTPSRGYQKIGNIKRDNQLTIEHKAFGFEAGAYVKKVIVSGYSGTQLVDVNYK